MSKAENNWECIKSTAKVLVFAHKTDEHEPQIKATFLKAGIQFAHKNPNDRWFIPGLPTNNEILPYDILAAITDNCLGCGC